MATYAAKLAWSLSALARVVVSPDLPVTLTLRGNDDSPHTFWRDAFYFVTTISSICTFIENLLK